MSDSHPLILLGSGFSKAINDVMPTLNQLSHQIFTMLNLDLKLLTGFSNFEEWMSYLSVDQPWLDDESNLENRVMFGRVRNAVNQAIVTSEHSTLATAYPSWLARLILSWSAQAADVVTLNYDLLVERMCVVLRRTSSWFDLYQLPITERTEPGMLGREGLGHSTLKLYKLHGSTNWGYGGDLAPDSDPIVMINDGGTWKPPVEGFRPFNKLPRYSDLVPLVIPPTVSKNPYYSRRSLRAQWNLASNALREARDIVIMGYSFPATDLAMKSWITTQAPKDARITVVDPNPDVAATVEKLGFARVEHFTGPDAIKSFVDSRCDSLLEWGAHPDGTGFHVYCDINGRKSSLVDLNNVPTFGECDEALMWIDQIVLAEFPQLHTDNIDDIRNTGGVGRLMMVKG